MIQSNWHEAEEVRGEAASAGRALKQGARGLLGLANRKTRLRNGSVFFAFMARWRRTAPEIRMLSPAWAQC